MNTLTVHGNLTEAPELRHGKTGDTAFATFSVAVNRRRYDRNAGQWAALAPVFHKVIAFGVLAENTVATARKGMAVTVTGELADDTYTAEDGRTVRGTRLQASDVAVSLRFATADVTANPKNGAHEQRNDPSEPAPHS